MASNDGPRGELLLQLLTRLLADSGGAMLGAAVGGIPGAGVGALASVGTSAALSYVARFDHRSAQLADDVVENARAQLGLTADQLAAWAESDEHLRLLVGVVEAAWRTRDRDKLRALSEVLADGIADDAKIDVDNLLAIAFRELEAPHLRVLNHMTQRPESDSGAWVLTTLEEQLPTLADGMAALLAALHRTGCIAIPSALGGGVTYVVTNFGRLLLRYVVRSGDAPSS